MSNWLVNSLNSNLIKSVYVKGFLDISGGDVITRNGNLYIAKDTELMGNVIINQNIGIGNYNPVYPLDVSGNAKFRNNVYVEGDISLNGRLFVKGDVSMNSRLYVAGGITTSAFTNTSDYRIKHNVQSLASTTFNVDALRPVFYDNELTQKPEFGLLAHEVQELFPFAVNGEKDGADYQSVNYVEFISLLIHEIQGLKKITNELLPLVEETQSQQKIIDDLREQLLVIQNGSGGL